jgi:hypothetical protein
VCKGLIKINKSFIIIEERNNLQIEKNNFFPDSKNLASAQRGGTYKYKHAGFLPAV